MFLRGSAFVFLFVAAMAQSGEGVTAQQLIEKIKTKTGIEWSPTTVDTIKAGDPATVVKGITTTMFPTLDVLKKSVAAGNNFILCHEPTFYNHKDDLTPLEKDDVQMAKLKYINDNKLVVFRFHDHWHRMNPDGINTGVIETMGWEKKLRKNDHATFELDATTVGDLAKLLKEKLKCSAVRVVGDPKMACSAVAYSAGAAGTLTQIATLQRDDIDVLVCGETREWETVEYTRDAAETGRKKALIVLGHSASEEPGMKYCAKWMEDVAGGIPVKFIPCGDPFWAP